MHSYGSVNAESIPSILTALKRNSVIHMEGRTSRYLKGKFKRQLAAFCFYATDLAFICIFGLLSVNRHSV